MSSFIFFFFSSRRRHTRLTCDWSSDVCSSDLSRRAVAEELQLDSQGWRAGRAPAVLVVRGALERGADRHVELRQGLWVLAPQIEVEPRLLWNRVEAGAAPSRTT